MEGDELTNSNENSPLARLKPEQARAIEKLLTTKSVAGAARASGVSNTTMYRWLAEPDFRAALVAIQQGRFDELNNEALRLGRKAFGVLEATMDDPNAPGWLRARAATDVLNFILRLHELVAFSGRLDALEGRIGQSHGPL